LSAISTWSPWATKASRVVAIAAAPELTTIVPCAPSSAAIASCSAKVVGVP
jgi:hypothetical protein